MRKRRALTLMAASTLATVVFAGPAAAAGHAPGLAIKQACGASFGQLVSAGQSSSDAFHTNYAGGAKAFSDPAILAAHGCTP